MSLRYIVPALGFLTVTTGALSAADSPVAIGGFVDTIGSVADTKDDHLSPQYDFQAATEVRLGYKIGEKVGAKLDLEWNNNNSGSYNGHPNTYVEQVFINYAITDQFSITTGKYTTYAGWVAADADGLYRINAGPIVALYGTELVGAALNYAPTKELGISLFAVNGLGLDTDGTHPFVNDRTNDNPDKYLSPAVDAVYNVDGIGSFNAEFGYDYHGKDLATWSAGVNATIKPKAYEPLTLGGEVIYQKTKNNLIASGDVKRLGALGMINHTLPVKTPMSLTLMGQYLSIKPDATDANDRTYEAAIALLTNPTGDAKFGVNFEVSYKVEDPDITGVDKIKSIWAGVELLAVVP